MKKISIITLLASKLLALANTDFRNWKLTDGRTVHAALFAFPLVRPLLTRQG